MLAKQFKIKQKSKKVDFLESYLVLGVTLLINLSTGKGITRGGEAQLELLKFFSAASSFN